MNITPKYSFELAVGSTNAVCHPTYKDDLAVECERASGEQYYRRKLTGKLTFCGPDYARINSAAFDTKFTLKIYYLFPEVEGMDWTLYWTGTFYKTDCEFDADYKTVTVTPTVTDEYDDILAGIEREFDLIKLAPEIVPIKADKRPFVQVYIPGESSIGCFLSDMYWEEDCEAESNETALQSTYLFSQIATMREVDVTQTGRPTIPEVFAGEAWPPTVTNKEIVNDDFKFTESESYIGLRYSITRISDNVELWRYDVREADRPIWPDTITLDPVAGTDATGTVELFIHDINVYARMLTDRPDIGTSTAQELPANDLVSDNRNYHYALGYAVENTIAFSARVSTTPTEWGHYDAARYFDKPLVSGILFPVARNSWVKVSVWFRASAISAVLEEDGRTPFTIKDTYPLASVISVLLAQIAPGLTFEGTSEYSQFLYGSTPLQAPKSLFVTPKSNVIVSEYDQPAQQAPIKLKTVMDMLRNCYRCYWFIDGTKFRIEHIRYFMNGERYSGSPGVFINLRSAFVSRNGKAYVYGQNSFKFDKPDMAARYQFGWMDNVSQPFEGSPIDIVSGYVTPGNIQTITVAQFTSDIDYILISPAEVSKDGFVLIAAELGADGYEVAYWTPSEYGTMSLQNGYASFKYLQDFYKWDMPAKLYKIDGNDYQASGLKRLKTEQVKFPTIPDPDPMELITTSIGDGVIRKFSVNLCSRNVTATLEYDTE